MTGTTRGGRRPRCINFAVPQSPPPQGEAAAHIVHGAAGAGATDVYVNSTTPTASGLAFGEISNEVEVTPDGGGQDRIVITTAGVATDTLLANGPSDEFDPGARFTVSILHQTPDVVGDVTILPARFGSSD